VAEIAAHIAQHMRLPVEVVSDVYFAGLLHDVGSMDLPEGLLARTGKLTEEEFERIKQSPQTAERILAGVRPLQRLRLPIRHLRERYDGEGYPDRLAGEDIPLMARILSVAEACDAMLSARPYRPALPASQVEAVLAEGAGRQWDPQVVAHFMACRKDVFRIGQGECRSSVGPAVERAVEGWSADSSESGFQQKQRTVKVACRETVTQRRK
jgi:HD-GYP domain-containing protein (c-di-GMP phosphodiesterase class II)